MGHHERDTDVVERRREEKSERKKDRKVINPTVELLSILELNLFLENKQPAGYNGFQPPLTCSHEYHYSHHKEYTTSIFMCTQHLKPEETQPGPFSKVVFHLLYSVNFT